MKRKNKLLLGIVGLASVALFASGCTANFSTNEEKSRIAYALEPGVSKFVVEEDLEKNKKDSTVVVQFEGTKVYQLYDVYKDENQNITGYSYSSRLSSIISGAKSSYIPVPSIEYFVKLDKIVFNKAVSEYNIANKTTLDLSTVDAETLKTCVSDFGYYKFFKDNDTFAGYRAINKELRNEGYTGSEVASIDFENYYISSLNSVVDSYRSTITVYSEYKYGNYGVDDEGNPITVYLSKTTWKDAWGKGGHLIEGLVVYPVAWMIDGFAHAFAGGKNASNADIQHAYSTGVPQILSILVVTVIVRLFIFLCTFRSVLAQRKMTELQPELAKIQQKYPNANTNQAQKQRLAEEQMRLYKKHHVNPLSQLLVLIIQFPVFIGVWGAMTGSAVLSTGKFLDLNLSASIWETLKAGPKAHPGWWTALVLILLMSAGQFFAMKIPQWIQKAKQKNVSKLSKNPAQQQQNRTANIVSYVMLIMIIVMGFTLPAAMGVYWFVGAIVSLIQTVFTNIIFAGNKKKN
jgi:YidC/Oxa1 family membrane protein insertase